MAQHHPHLARPVTSTPMTKWATLPLRASTPPRSTTARLRGPGPGCDVMENPEGYRSRTHPGQGALHVPGPVRPPLHQHSSPSLTSQLLINFFAFPGQPGLMTAGNSSSPRASCKIVVAEC